MAVGAPSFGRSRGLNAWFAAPCEPGESPAPSPTTQLFRLVGRSLTPPTNAAAWRSHRRAFDPIEADSLLAVRP